jgi:hypothetical protein
MMEPVQSSNIAEIGYATTNMTLAIKFLSGDYYTYQNVPPNVYVELKNAGSKGSYLNSNIKGKYTATKVSEADIEVLFGKGPKAKARRTLHVGGAQQQKLRAMSGAFLYF